MSDVTAGDPGAPGVLVLHPWWGVTPWVERFCERVAGEGFSVRCPDLYSGRTASTIDEAEALTEALDGPTAHAVVADAALRLAASSKGEIGALGFSMGGQFAMSASARTDVVRAVVTFYGGVDPADAEVTRARAFQGHFCAFDAWENLDVAQTLFADLAEAGYRSELYVYEGADHWFMEDDRPDVYAPDAARQAFERSIAFLRGELTA